MSIVSGVSDVTVVSMSTTIRPNKQTHEALQELQRRLQAASPVRVSMSATVEYAVRLAAAALRETGAVGRPPKEVIGQIAGRRIEGAQDPPA